VQQWKNATGAQVMYKPMECPKCKEISLFHRSTKCEDGKPTIESWFCDECYHMECFHVPAVTAHEINDAVKERDNFDDWIQKMGGLDFIDDLEKVEGMRIAFLAGISAQQDIEIARLDRDISLLRNQAE